MRHKRTGEPFAPSQEIPLPQLDQGPAGRLQLWAARAANDPRASARRPTLNGTGPERSHPATHERTGEVRSDPRRTRAPAHQDADWDNDATTLFRRDDRVLGEGAYHPPPSAAGARAQDYVSEPPAPVTLSVQAGVTRSLWPARGAGKLRPFGLAVTLLVFVFGSIALWSERGLSWKMGTPEWWASAAKPLSGPRFLTRGLPVEAPTEEPPPAAQPEPPALAAAFDALPEVEVEERPAKRGKASRAHRSNAHEQRPRNAQRARKSVARPIQPLREPLEVEEEAGTSEPAPEGILQVNSRPWARVIVDGRFVGNTPQRALKLPAGRHRVQLINEPLEMSKMLDVVITAGETITRVELLDDNPTDGAQPNAGP